MKPASILSMAMLFLLLGASCSAWSRQYYDDGVSDEEYLRIAGKTEEAQAFLKQFPETEILVDRSSRLAVDYRFTQIQPATTEQAWEGIRLRVFIAPENRRVEGALIQCSDQDGGTRFVEEGLIRYLEQYTKSHGCP